MRTSLSRTTGRGVPAGTSNEIAAGDPATISVAPRFSACAKLNPTDKKIKRIAEGMARIRFVLLFSVAPVRQDAERFIYSVIPSEAHEKRDPSARSVPRNDKNLSFSTSRSA